MKVTHPLLRSPQKSIIEALFGGNPGGCGERETRNTHHQQLGYVVLKGNLPPEWWYSFWCPFANHQEKGTLKKKTSFVEATGNDNLAQSPSMSPAMSPTYTSAGICGRAGARFFKGANSPDILRLWAQWVSVCFSL